MQLADVWDQETARSYDTPGTGMFSPEVLGPAVDRLAELAGDARALEFAVGTGRVAIPLARRGVPVTGIELSRPMIEQLRTKADATAIPVVAGNMATTQAPGEYALVYVVYNAISCLLTQSEQVACFRNAARHLTPGGRFVIELWVPELRKLPPGQQAIVCKTEPGYIGLDTYDVLHQHVVSHHFTFGADRQAGLPQPAPLHLAVGAGPDGAACRIRARGAARRLGRSRVHCRVPVSRLGLPAPGGVLALGRSQPQRSCRPRPVHSSEGVLAAYRANSMARDSRITVTRIWPG